MSFLVTLLLWSACAFLTAIVSDEKGHDWLLWGLAGIIFGPVGLVAAVGLPDKKLRRYIRRIGEKQGAVEPEVLEPSDTNIQQ